MLFTVLGNGDGSFQLWSVGRGSGPIGSRHYRYENALSSALALAQFEGFEYVPMRLVEVLSETGETTAWHTYENSRQIGQTIALWVSCGTIGKPVRVTIGA